MNELVLKNIYKSYGGEVNAVNDFNLSVNEGEFIVIVGPSGCGKSTVLRMIAGLEEVTEGHIIFNDEVINNKEPKDRDVAMVFQNYALYESMTVYDNIAFPLKMRKVNKKEIEKKVMEICNLLSLNELIKRKPSKLSGGERQRVALGRAMVRKPKLFLLDEPLANLDAKLRDNMRQEIIRLHKEIGTTFIYVTHDQTEAMTMADRIVVMKDGIVQQIGTPVEIYENPCNTFVARFIGMPQMNFISGSLIKGYHNHISEKTVCGIRAEHIHINNEGKYEMQIINQEFSGSCWIIYGYVNCEQVAVKSDKHILKNPVRVDFENDKIHFFDFNSGSLCPEHY